VDLHTVTELIRPQDRGTLPKHRAGDAFLAGGTWLFSEPQTHLHRLIDLCTLPLGVLRAGETGLYIPATCTLAALQSYAVPPQWWAATVIGQSCNALLGSFKITCVATVGGNLCLALPASPMAALAVALHGTCTIWQPDGAQRTVAARDLITGPQTTSLGAGEILCDIHLPAQALRRRAAFRQMSLTALGRSAALLIGTTDGTGFTLTITASTKRPIQVDFPAYPALPNLHAAMDAEIPDWLDDVHGAPAWRRRITHILAADIHAELLA
jgi:CO/xanthine dehydrogenase FAD-binding subunit